MPLVTQVTFVLRGQLEVCMKDAETPYPYILRLDGEQAVLTCPGTFFQLINSTTVLCRVLYITSPAYLFEMDQSGQIKYDDAVVLDEDWQELAELNCQAPKLRAANMTMEARYAAFARLAKRAKH